jgi:hypothetical protein
MDGSMGGAIARARMERGNPEGIGMQWFSQTSSLHGVCQTWRRQGRERRFEHRSRWRRAKTPVSVSREDPEADVFRHSKVRERIC